LAQGKKGAFYYTLEEFSKYWERIDVVCPKVHQTSNPEPLTKIFGNVFIHSSCCPLIFQPFFIYKKGKEIFKEQKFNLFTVHSYPPFYNDLGGLWLYKSIGKPYVSEVHHITGYPRAGSFKEKIYRFLTLKLIKFFTNKAKAVRVVNQKQVPEFLLGSGLKMDKIKYIPSAYIDLEIFKPENAEKKYDLVFSGRLTKNKGIMLLLKTISNIKKQMPNIKIIIIGSGPLENRIKNYIKQSQLEDNIELSGWLPNMEDLAKIYNRSKILVMPSFNEGGPRVCLEAMACKTSIITTKVGIMPDIIQDGENGLFIDWSAKDIAEKIMLLLKDENLRSKIAENGYHTAQQFERKKMIKNYAETYQNLLYSSGV